MVRAGGGRGDEELTAVGDGGDNDLAVVVGVGVVVVVGVVVGVVSTWKGADLEATRVER